MSNPDYFAYHSEPKYSIRGSRSPNPLYGNFGPSPPPSASSGAPAPPSSQSAWMGQYPYSTNLPIPPSSTYHPGSTPTQYSTTATSAYQTSINLPLAYAPYHSTLPSTYATSASPHACRSVGSTHLFNNPQPSALQSFDGTDQSKVYPPIDPRTALYSDSARSSHRLTNAKVSAGSTTHRTHRGESIGMGEMAAGAAAGGAMAGLILAENGAGGDGDGEEELSSTFCREFWKTLDCGPGPGPGTCWYDPSGGTASCLSDCLTGTWEAMGNCCNACGHCLGDCDCNC
ncbi:uncharacterized protein I303_101247 [Kwoniella dejecticola CBS 10117]|uniref:Uncharacterized protein n=1 Tax=Kwoniella dejecticola CBS 10117 TaxID=1296121 RepID=A0A1A6AH81_9TREE|nr:uncharacterized protein I303_01254 [Kwoniella dejecticola CBS 10117]OBR89427.1 hypothetical protein I303_01254 [Kwoniella dejecticola CBS 10117]